MTEKTRFNNTEMSALRGIVLRRRPGLAHLLEALGRRVLTMDEREAIRDVLADEFCERGLGAGDEPNRYGILVDRMIDVLMHY